MDALKAWDSLEQLYLSLELELPERILWLDSPAQALLALASLPECPVETVFFERLMGPYLAFFQSCSEVFPDPPWSELARGRRARNASALTRAGLDEFRRSCTDIEQLDASWLRRASGVLHLPSQPELWESFARQHRGWNESFTFNAASYCTNGQFTLYSPKCLDFDELGEKLYEIRKLRSRRKPPWREQLQTMSEHAGWLWPRQGAVLVARKPVVSRFRLDDVLDSQEGAALEWADGWQLWAHEGKLVPRRASQNPSSLGPGDIVGDLEQQRTLLRRKGPGLLDEPGWPAHLRHLALMVFERQYHRFDASHLSGPWQPWPEGQEPRPLCSFGQGNGMPNGRYASFYEDGQLRTVGVARGGALGWLWLDRGRAEGYFQLGPCSEKYFADGRVEDFSPWDDTSKPYPVETNFLTWVRAHLRRMEA